MEKSVRTLASLVVFRALLDKTDPDPANPRRGWRTDELLVGDIDAFVVGHCGDPAAYVQIAQKVRQEVVHLPAMAALAGIAAFRGTRLLPVTPEREEELVRMAKALEKEVEALPEGPRKIRCNSFLLYNEGIFLDAYGPFDLAADVQYQSELEALRLGDIAGAAIANFCRMSNLLKDALKNERFTESGPRFAGLEVAFNMLVEAVRGSSMEVQWAEANGPFCMLEACVWFGFYHPSWSQWVEMFLIAAQKLGESHSPGVQFVKAVELDRLGNEQAEKALTDIAIGNDINERRATAYLILARRALRAGKADEARDIVSKMPQQGAQHVVAIARQMLAS